MGADRHMLRNRRTLGKKRVKWQLWSMCALPILFIFVFSYLPMCGIVIAFKDYRFNKGIWGSEWVGLKNFQYIFESQVFWRVVRNTLGNNLLFLVTGTAAAVFFAILMYEVQSKRATKIFQTISITPTFVSIIIISYIVYAVLNPVHGLLNQIIVFFGGKAIDWYTRPYAWPIILAIVNIWKGVGYSSIIYYSSLMSIDPSLFEAAELDGASKRQLRKYIMIPSLVPVITVLTILKIGSIFGGDFGLFYTVTRNVGMLYETTDILSTYVYRTMTSDGNMSVSTAMGFLQSVVGMAVVIITNYVVKKIEPDNSLF